MTEPTPPVVRECDRELYLTLGIFHACSDDFIRKGLADQSSEMLSIAAHRAAAVAEVVAWLRGDLDTFTNGRTDSTTREIKRFAKYFADAIAERFK